ncbi:arsenate reductase ArsC [Hyphococcus sp. DH-69]|uniref:arsenate reductase ArsC n=1 Tax=Hyphococcus formosus TaxID=3143534 RepID=UPI00398B3B26
MKNILFLCTGNSARSIMAEAYMNHAGAKNWRAYSAGSSPTGTVNPYAIETLSAHNIAPANEPRSKSWDAFADTGAPIMDVIVTVCDNAAGETCPIWPRREGQTPTILHWGFPDPAGAENEPAAFKQVFEQIRSAIDRFLTEQK